MRDETWPMCKNDSENPGSFGITKYLHIPSVIWYKRVLTEMLKNCFSSISESSAITTNIFVSVDNFLKCLARLKTSLWFFIDVLDMTIRQRVSLKTLFVILPIHSSFLPCPKVSEVRVYAT